MFPGSWLLIKIYNEGPQRQQRSKGALFKTRELIQFRTVLWRGLAGATGWVRWHKPVIPAPGRGEDGESDVQGHPGLQNRLKTKRAAQDFFSNKGKEWQRATGLRVSQGFPVIGWGFLSQGSRETEIWLLRVWASLFWLTGLRDITFFLLSRSLPTMHLILTTGMANCA